MTDLGSASINLTALQRKDPSITSILHTSRHVVLYDLQHQGSAIGWEKRDVEGPLFIVTRLREPFFQLVVMNRKSVEDFLQPLLPNMELEEQSQYVFFKCHGAIVGLWFLTEADAHVAASQVRQILKQLETATAAHSAAGAEPVTPSADPASATLLTLLRGQSTAADPTMPSSTERKLVADGLAASFPALLKSPSDNRKQMRAAQGQLSKEQLGALLLEKLQSDDQFLEQVYRRYLERNEWQSLFF